jgi:hypothetical protein
LSFLLRSLALATFAAGFAGLSQVALAQSRATELADAALPTKVILEPKAVVELFTSQGCSSCPTADALLTKLAERDDIITLSWSVDYWDYLGWKDTLASPRFSERQHAYGKARGDGAIYTPQVVVNGVAHVNGTDEARIVQTIDKTAKSLSASHVSIRVSRDKNKLVVEAAASPPGTVPKEATLWLVVLSRSVTVPINRGENQGRTITYTNVVREVMPVGVWSGKPLNVQLERHSFMRPGTDACAVLLQEGRAGAIVGAALLEQF